MDQYLTRKKLMGNATLKMKYLLNLNLSLRKMQTTLNTHALTTKNRYEVLCKSGEDCKIS